MPYYVRFLKVPRIVRNERELSSPCVTALITITSDLGDSFLAEDATIVASLRIGDGKDAVSFDKKYQWKATSRELQLVIGPVSKQRSQTSSPSAQLSVQAADTHGTVSDPLHGCRIISAWSPLFVWQDGGQADKLVQRRFACQPELRIWEETGNSIARHIWDAALACVAEIENCVAGQDGSISLLQELLRSAFETNKHLNVIELGTGCGIVGVALAQVLPQCSVYLTDLEEARDIVSRNLSVAKRAPGAAVQFEVLDWDEEPRDSIARRQYDLIIVSDCTYNSDSMPALVRTLRSLIEFSANAAVMVGLKRRHESEQVFFELMEDSGFEKCGDTIMGLSSVQPESIEIHCFQKRISR